MLHRIALSTSLQESFPRSAPLPSFNLNFIYLPAYNHHISSFVNLLPNCPRLFSNIRCFSISSSGPQQYLIIILFVSNTTHRHATLILFCYHIHWLYQCKFVNTISMYIRLLYAKKIYIFTLTLSMYIVQCNAKRNIRKMRNSMSRFNQYLCLKFFFQISKSIFLTSSKCFILLSIKTSP